MKKIFVNASKSYDVVIDAGVLDRLENYQYAFKKAQKLCIVSDDKVFALHGERVQKKLENMGFEVQSFVFENGERSKNAGVLIDLLEFLAENKFTRTDMLVALGGGVVGDLCGFAAAVYLRGVDFLQIPTTLLAMVDSSVGGKTAIDIKGGKNLVGAFHQPNLVLCDTSVLSTLDDSVFRDGCAEVIKYALAFDDEFYNELLMGLSKSSENLENAIFKSVSIKRNVVEADEFDNGERQLLNYGHTLGHAIEKLSDFTVTHGSAVAKGMNLASMLAKNMGFEDTSEKTKKILDLYGFDLSVCYEKEDILAASMNDKKRKGSDITLILPEKIGKCKLCKVTTAEFAKIFETIEI